MSGLSEQEQRFVARTKDAALNRPWDSYGYETVRYLIRLVERLQESADSFEPSGWWRTVLADGSLWCETSSESEARESLESSPQPATLQRHMRSTTERWDEVNP